MNGIEEKDKETTRAILHAKELLCFKSSSYPNKLQTKTFSNIPSSPFLLNWGHSKNYIQVNDPCLVMRNRYSLLFGIGMGKAKVLLCTTVTTRAIIRT